MKVAIDQRAHLGSDDVVERAMARYQVAYARYEHAIGRNRDLTLSGGTPSRQSRRDEERAFDALDSARHALFTAAAVAFPTVH